MSLNSGCGLLQGGFKCGTVEVESDKCRLQVIFKEDMKKINANVL
jgi:hypothetical protein